MAVRFHRVATYRSGLEATIADQLRSLGVPVVYEKHKVTYEVPKSVHTYTPDFLLPNGIYIETKGLFSVEDRKKHLLIQKQHPELDIRFVFQSPNSKLYKGSKTTYAQWAEKYGFKWAKKTIPVEWIKEEREQNV